MTRCRFRLGILSRSAIRSRCDASGLSIRVQLLRTQFRLRAQYRSAENVLAEIGHVVERFHPRNIRIEDETFGLNVPRTRPHSRRDPRAWTGTAGQLLGANARRPGGPRLYPPAQALQFPVAGDRRRVGQPGGSPPDGERHHARPGRTRGRACQGREAWHLGQVHPRPSA